MKTIILAAGEGKRMRPLTLKIPKPLILVNGKPVIDYAFDVLPKEIAEVVVVIRYLGDQIKRYLGNEYRGKKISYAEGSIKGTAYSILAAKNFIKKDERFLFLHGDEFHARDDILNCLAHPLSAIVAKYDQPEKAAVVSLDKEGCIIDVVEKPEHPKSNLIVGGIMVLSADIFSYTPTQHKNGEFYFTSMLAQFVKDHLVKAVLSKNFIGDITTPDDIKNIELMLSKKGLL